jgi:outer membrane protein OmpA-like peptidoglycan-associated protein
VAVARIEAKGWGTEKPLATNRTEAGRTQNRRVELTVLPPAP